MRFIRPFREILFLATVDTSVAEVDKLEKLFRESVSVIFRKGYYFWPPRRKMCHVSVQFPKGWESFYSIVREHCLVSNPFVIQSSCLNYSRILTR